MQDHYNKLKVMGIIGSPRKQGNTERLIDKVLDGAQSGGAIIEKVHLSDWAFSPCRACEACKKKNYCIVDDDYSQILSRMKDSDIWVLGTPVYYWGPTGWFKAFMDRWYGARYQVDFSSKKAVLVVPFEDTNEQTGRHTEGMIRDALEYMKVEIIGTLMAPGLLHKNDTEVKEHYLTDADQIGRDIARLCENLDQVG